MKNLVLCLGLAFALVGMQNMAHAQTRQADSLALVMLYDSTDGANWTTTWDLTMPMSSWNGVTLTGGRVTTVDLSSTNLVGTLPDLSLPNLVELSLEYNQLTGSIPNFINLPNLETLILAENQLSGSIPDFANLSNLIELLLFSNQLTGSIPNPSNLPNLTYLFLDNNQLTGSIPNFSNLPKLTVLSSQNNQLTGSIPNFASLPNLETLIFAKNQLSGSIPDFSSLPNLETLILSENQLSGSIPNFSNLPKLTVLSSQNNQLTGSIPEFANLPNLTMLRLSYNQLSGMIPDFVFSPNITRLFIENNQFTFEDLLPAYDSLTSKISSTQFRYNNQDSVGITQVLSFNTLSNYTLNLAIDDTVSTNTYYWYQNNILVDSTFGVNNYTFLTQQNDTSTFYAQVVNSKVTNRAVNEQNLVLYSRGTTLQIATAIRQINRSTLHVQPNPVSDVLYINTQDIQGDFSVRVIDMQGRVVEQLQGSGSTVFRLPMAQQPAGTYIVRMQQADKVWQQKVVKQ